MTTKVSLLRAHLANWARWARVWATTGYGHCRSIEHRYMPPRCWDEPAPRQITDEIDAWRIECAWRTLNDRDRTALKCEWILRWGIMVKQHIMSERTYLDRMVRKLGVCRADVPAYVFEAEQMLQDKLQSHEQPEKFAGLVTDF